MSESKHCACALNCTNCAKVIQERKYPRRNPDRYGCLRIPAGMLLVVSQMVSFSVLMNLIMRSAVSFAIAFFLMPLVMVRTVDSLAALAVRAAVVAAAVVAVGHDRGGEASRQNDGGQHGCNCFFPFL